MRLSELIRELPHRAAGPAADPEVGSLTHDSRRAGPGTLFAAFPGLVSDGRDFLADAVRRGAVAALGPSPAPPGLSVPYLAVEEPRKAAGELAARLVGSPAGRLVMAGITGTSGKTTTAVLLDAALAPRHPVRGLFGTLVYRFGGEAEPAPHTTPEATELQPRLAALVSAGGTAAVLECSSHALALDRLAGCRFDVAVFTNLSREHLDFHPDVPSYFEAKARLFSLLGPGGRAVVNADDPWGDVLLRRLPPAFTLSFSLDPARRAGVSGVARLSASGIDLSVTARESGVSLRVVSPLLGRPNAENLLAAAAAALALGLDPEETAAALSRVDKVPGRLEPVPNALGLTVLVDYAHKPAALEGVLRTTRPLVGDGGRLVVVFGCGGDRDRGKRPFMGRLAAQLADVVVLTSDNPRSERPEAIVDEIRVGAVAAGAVPLCLVDRREAIEAALRAARPGDVVVIAGKGHETYQEAAGVKTPFDDRRVASEVLSALAAAGPSRSEGSPAGPQEVSPPCR